MTQRFYTILIVPLLLLLSFSCQKPPAHDSGKGRIVRLDKLSPLPEQAQKAVKNELRVAVSAILSPKGTVESYRPLFNYLENIWGEPIKLIQRRTYKEVNLLIATGEVDLAFVCTGAYRQGLKAGSMDLLVVPQIDGKTTYNSLLIGRSDSKAHGLKDFRNEVFVFTDPLSNSGYLYPLSLLTEIGEEPTTFFKSYSFTYSHDRSIKAVSEELADGAFVDSIVYRHHARNDAGLASHTKIIFTSPPFGIPPVVVPKTLPLTMKARLKDIFLRIHESPQGLSALKALEIERFVEESTERYQQSPCSGTLETSTNE